MSSRRLVLAGENAQQSLGQAAARRPRVRSYSLQNRMPQIVSADCRKQQHYYCNSLNCACPCGHGGKAR